MNTDFLFLSLSGNSNPITFHQTKSILPKYI